MRNMAYQIPTNEAELTEFLSDPEKRLFSGILYKIMIKGDDGEAELAIPFIPNRAQRRFIKRLWHRNIILKARQLGFCVSPEMRILTADLRWIPIGEVEPGTEVVACDESTPGGRGRARKMRTATVEAVKVMQAERYRISNALYDHNNIDMYSVGVVYRFGAEAAPAPVVKALPPAPEPAPVVIAPPAPRFEKYTLSSTELFGFDSERLSMPQPKLDQIAAALKTDGGPTQIVIVGHTDRLGSDEYNQKLSERRADAVKSYIASKGVEAGRLQVVGKGESEPVVQCTETNKAALIECLKPNRRVEIDQVVVERKVNP